MAFSRMVVFYVLINHRYRDIFTDIFQAPLELLLFQNWKNTSKLPKIPFSELKTRAEIRKPFKCLIYYIFGLIYYSSISIYYSINILRQLSHNCLTTTYLQYVWFLSVSETCHDALRDLAGLSWVDQNIFQLWRFSPQLSSGQQDRGRSKKCHH